MEPTIFKFILRYSKAQQLWLLAVIAGSYPFLYLSLDMPKMIVNRAIGDVTQPPPPFYEFSLFGLSPLNVEMEQLEFLLMLSAVYLLLVFMNGLFKYYINVYKGQMGERLLRRLRYQLYERILRFPLPHFRKVSQGELIPMITAEVEPLGGFIGTAFADPMFHGGQLIIILSFIMIQDWRLGLAAIAFYPFQMYVIPKLQRHVNELGKQRVNNVRQLSEHIGESVSGIVDIHAHDTGMRELSRFADRLGAIYQIRYEIYRRKFFIKFLNNFIDKLTPFFFFSIGGYLVINGFLTIGALVAVLAAYKDLAGPWKEMLAWYQQKEDVRIKYGQVTSKFSPAGMMPFEMLESDGDGILADGSIDAQNLSLFDDEGHRQVDSASLKIPSGQRIALVGSGSSGAGEFVMALAGLSEPAGGSILIGGHNIARLPHAVTGRSIAYVGPNSYLQAGTVADAITYGLKHRPGAEPETSGDAAIQRTTDVQEAGMTGNTTFDFAADWIDYQAAGVSGPEELRRLLLSAVHAVDLDPDIYLLGLRGTVDPKTDPDTAQSVLEARIAMRARLQEPAAEGTVEPFDITRYNANASVAENLLFGVPLGDALSDERIAGHPYVQRVLESVGLTGEFLRIGERIAETMVELFADLPPGHEFFDQFSFISAESLPEFQAVLGRSAQGLEALGQSDRRRLMALPFRLVPAQHRLDLIDEPVREKLLRARRMFAQDLPDELAGEVAFFDVSAYNPGASIQDNILFGKLVYGQANAELRVSAMISEVLNEQGLRDVVIAAGLDSQIGSGGSRQTPAQRQKTAIARCLVKRPRLLLVNEAANALGARTQSVILDNILSALGEATVVWALNNLELTSRFDRIVVMQDGRIVEDGAYDELAAIPEGEFARLLREQ